MAGQTDMAVADSEYTYIVRGICRASFCLLQTFSVLTKL